MLKLMNNEANELMNKANFAAAYEPMNPMPSLMHAVSRPTTWPVLSSLNVRTL